MCSSCHCAVNRVTTDSDKPAADPKNPDNAGAKSPELIPWRYINGNTSDTLGDLRHHGIKIELENRHRSPVASSTRRSLTFGASTAIGPAPVTIGRGRGMRGVMEGTYKWRLSRSFMNLTLVTESGSCF